MPIITLPDGSQKTFPTTVTVQDVAASIGAGLAKAALAGKIDQRLVDLDYPIEQDAQVQIITDRDPEGLEIIRHSSAHLLAYAVKTLFPEAQVTIGPVIENGFYYDFSYPKGFTPADLEQIEAKMKQIAQSDCPVTHTSMTRDAAIEFFRAQGEEYKAKIIEDIPANETLTIYKQGNFVDLCRGPHVPNLNRLKAFKLMKLAGAYWRGDSKNEMLQRIYGTAWADQKALITYLQQLEEAEKRDHRKIAKKMDLFHIQPEAPGMVFWHPNGWIIYQTIQQYLQQKFRQNGYLEIRTPQLVDASLWERSGHLAKFGEEMFTVTSEERNYAIKPMSCPCHVQVFNQGLKSYRDLPLRLAEFGACHRNEPSGTLHGLMRIRGFVQDDGHIFCTEEQIQDEVSRFIDQLYEIYADFGFREVVIKLSTRPENRVGSDEMWDKAEKGLADALDGKQLKWELQPGEGAFYGPKIEFSLRDCLGRIWQLGTMQIDFAMPERLDAYYIAEDGSKKHPVMLHRAVMGSLERFIGILLEEYADNLPIWLAPIQAVVANITDQQADYVTKVTENLKNLGLRVTSDLRNEKISFKIREHTIARVPYLLIIGDREKESETVTVRTVSGKDLGNMPLTEFVQHINKQIASRNKMEE